MASATWAQEFFDENYAFWYGPASAAARSEAEIDALLAIAPLRPGQLVIDAGCGFGRHLEVLGRRGLRTLGLDRSAVQLNLARRRGCVTPLVHLIQGDYRSMPVRSVSADLLFCIGHSLGYESSADYAQFFSEAHRVLRPHGLVILEIWLWDSLADKADCPLARPSIRELHGPNPGSISRRRTIDSENQLLVENHDIQLLDGRQMNRHYETYLLTAEEVQNVCLESGFRMAMIQRCLLGPDIGDPTSSVIVAMD
jgi:SAM-dependent methyltransferase